MRLLICASRAVSKTVYASFHEWRCAKCWRCEKCCSVRVKMRGLPLLNNFLPGRSVGLNLRPTLEFRTHTNLTRLVQHSTVERHCLPFRHFRNATVLMHKLLAVTVVFSTSVGPKNMHWRDCTGFKYETKTVTSLVQLLCELRCLHFQMASGWTASGLRKCHISSKRTGKPSHTGRIPRVLRSYWHTQARVTCPSTGHVGKSDEMQSSTHHSSLCAIPLHAGKSRLKAADLLALQPLRLRIAQCSTTSGFPSTHRCAFDF